MSSYTPPSNSSRAAPNEHPFRIVNVIIMKLVIQPASKAPAAATTQQVVNAFTMTCALTQFIP
jgi:hypothetical protein